MRTGRQRGAHTRDREAGMFPCAGAEHPYLDTVDIEPAISTGTCCVGDQLTAGNRENSPGNRDRERNFATRVEHNAIPKLRITTDRSRRIKRRTCRSGELTRVERAFDDFRAL